MRLSPRRGALAAGAVAVLVHAMALGNGFAYDDVTVVAGDPGIHALGELPGRLVEPYWPTSYGAEVGSWRPLTTALFGLTWAAGGGSPVLFHAVGVALHGFATALVVLLLAFLLPAAGALAGGLLFAVHPVHVEAVANVVGTAEPLAASLALAAALLHLRGGDGYGAGRAAAVAAFYALAVLAKEGAAVIPLLLVLLDAARRDIRVTELAAYLRRRGVLFALLTVVLAGVLAARSQVLGAAASPSPPPGMAVLEEIPRIWTLALTWPHYVRLLVFPVELAADYGPGVIPVAFGWTTPGVVGVLLVVLLLVAAAVSWRWPVADSAAASPRVAGLGILWSSAALLPVAHVAFLSPTILAERTLYMASVGAALAFGWLFLRLRDERPTAGWVLVGVAVLAGGARSAARVPDWRDSDSVMESLLVDHPESGRGWWYYGGKLAQAGRGPESRKAFTHALGLLDSEYQVAVDVASHLMAQGRSSSARFFLERAWRERPEWYTAPGLLAALEVQEGRFASAVPAAEAATRLQPSNPSMHHLLAQALSGSGRPAEAVPARRAALDRGFADRWRSWLLLAVDLDATGDRTGALAALDSAGARADSPEARRTVDEARAALDSNPPEIN